MGHAVEELADKLELARIPVIGHIRRIGGKNVKIAPHVREEGGSGQVGTNVDIEKAAGRERAVAKLKKSMRSDIASKLKMDKSKSRADAIHPSWDKAPKSFSLEADRAAFKSKGHFEKPGDLDYLTKEYSPKEKREQDALADERRRQDYGDSAVPLPSAGKDESNDKGFYQQGDKTAKPGTVWALSPSGFESRMKSRDKSDEYNSLIKVGKPIPPPHKNPVDTYFASPHERVAAARVAFPKGPKNFSEAEDIKSFVRGDAPINVYKNILERIPSSKNSEIYRKRRDLFTIENNTLA
jgi:hypothetical protein